MGNIKKEHAKEDREKFTDDPIIKQCQFSLSLILQTAIPIKTEIWKSQVRHIYDQTTEDTISFYKAQIDSRIKTLKEAHT